MTADEAWWSLELTCAEDGGTAVQRQERLALHRPWKVPDTCCKFKHIKDLYHIYRDDMAELKTKKNDASVERFLNAVDHPKRREDAWRVLEIMKKVTKEEPKMWGPSIVGFGSYHYRYASGQEGDWMLVGFSPRKTALSVYIMSGFDAYDELMSQLGKYKTGKSCLYINKLEDVDLKVLENLIKQSVAYMKKANHIAE